MSRPAQRWALGLYAGPTPFTLAPIADVNPLLTRWQVSAAAAGFVADPFLLWHAGRWLLAFEVMNETSGKGEIGLATSTDGRAFTYHGIVLAEPFHLSYPALVASRGEAFLVPETLDAGAVRLYRVGASGATCEPAGELVAGRLADPTPFEHAGRWWLFACATPERHDTLVLYHAPALRGPWRPHVSNPIVVADPRRARPAGRVIAHDGRLWRLAQDCGDAYGSRVLAVEILELTPERYREGWPVPLLEPTGSGWNGARMHHLDAHRLADGTWLAVVDGYASEGGEPAGALESDRPR